MSIETTAYGTHRVRWKDAGGHQRARTFKKRKDAERFERETLTDLGRGLLPSATAARTTVAAWSEEWLASAMNLSAGSHDTYRQALTYILPELGDLQLRQLTPGAIDEFLAGELDRLAPSTVHRHYRTIRRMCQVAVERGRLVRNPCETVTPPRIPDKEMRFLTVDEVDRLAMAINHRYRAWVYVAAYGGLRWSETVGLRRLDVRDEVVTIAGQLVRRDGVWIREEPKTRAGRRTVTMPAFVADELGEHLEVIAGPGRDELVFTTRNGDPVEGMSFRGNVFKSALRRAGLEHEIRPHDLRHTAVALAIAAGAHPKAIQSRMGHASITVTLDRYGHLFPEMDATVAEGLEQLHRQLRVVA